MSLRAARLLAFVLISALAALPAAAQQIPPAVSVSDLSFPTSAGRLADPWISPAQLPGADRAPSVVPEPATFALLAFSCLALRRRPR